MISKKRSFEEEDTINNIKDNNKDFVEIDIRIGNKIMNYYICEIKDNIIEPTIDLTKYSFISRNYLHISCNANCPIELKGNFSTTLKEIVILSSYPYIEQFPMFPPSVETLKLFAYKFEDIRNYLYYCDNLKYLRISSINENIFSNIQIETKNK